MDWFTPSDLMVLKDKGYTIDTIVGDGGFCKVFKSTRHAPGAKQGTAVACKIIDAARSPRHYCTKFLPRELDILINVNHPHIIHIYSIFQRRSKYFIFMRLGENGDLLTFLSKNGRVSENQSRLWMRQLLSALQYMHAMHVAHRDLKCDNIMITANFNAKLTDFGFARYVRHQNTDVLSETYCGTISYAAPEVIKGLPYLPKLADLWSMGVILYVMLNQSMPFEGTTVKVLYEKQVMRQWRFRTSVVNKLSTECKQLVTELLDPGPAGRPTAESVLAGPWIYMNVRLAALTPAEESLLQRAAAIEKRFVSHNIEEIRWKSDFAPRDKNSPIGTKILKVSDPDPGIFRTDSVKLVQD